MSSTDLTAGDTDHPIRVLVVDDQELVRAGFCVILNAAEGISVVGRRRTEPRP